MFYYLLSCLGKKRHVLNLIFEDCFSILSPSLLYACVGINSSSSQRRKIQNPEIFLWVIFWKFKSVHGNLDIGFQWALLEKKSFSIEKNHYKFHFLPFSGLEVSNGRNIFHKMVVDCHSNWSLLIQTSMKQIKVVVPENFKEEILKQHHSFCTFWKFPSLRLPMKDNKLKIFLKYIPVK